MNPRKNDVERAVSLLHRDGYTGMVLCDRDRVLTRREKQVAHPAEDTNNLGQDMGAAVTPDAGPPRCRSCSCAGVTGLFGGLCAHAAQAHFDKGDTHDESQKK